MNITMMIIGVVVWAYCLIVCYRKKLATLGSFFLAMALFCGLFTLIPYFEYEFIYMFTLLLSPLGEILGLFEGDAVYGLIIFCHNNHEYAYYITLLTSAIIEILLFLSLLITSPIYKILDKFIYALIGFFVINYINAVKISLLAFYVFLIGDMFYNIFYIFVSVIYCLTIFIVFKHIFANKKRMLMWKNRGE